MVAVVTLALDLAQVASVLFGVTGVVAGIGAFIVNRTTAKSSVGKNYVDTNMEVLQGTIDVLVAEVARWQLRYEKQRIAFEAELADVEEKLAECQQSCTDAMNELRKLKGTK